MSESNVFSPLSTSPSSEGRSGERLFGASTSSTGDATVHGSGVNTGSSERIIPPGKSSVYKASFNFINSIVGAGIIGMPFAIGECGLIGGIILMVCVAMLVARSVKILIECGEREGCLDYEDLANHLLGKQGYYAALTSMFLFAFGAQVAYLIIIGDTIPILTGANREVVIGMVGLCVVLPLSMLQDMTNLSYTSLAAIAFDLTIIIIVISVAPDAASRQDISPSLKDGTLRLFSPRVFAGIGTLSFAFVCMHNSFIVYRSLKERTEANWNKVAYGSVSFCLTVAMAFGLSGYLSFGTEVEGDILNNFKVQRASIDLARVLLAVCMIFVYPMEMFVSRHCIVSLLTEFGLVEGRGEPNPAESGAVATTTSDDSKEGMLRVRGNSHDSAVSSSGSCDGAEVEIRLSLDERKEREESVRTAHPLRSEDDGQTAVTLISQQASVMRSTFWADFRVEMDRGGGRAALHVVCALVSVHVSLAMEEASAALADPPYRVHATVTISLWLISIVLAISFNDLGVVLALTGAVAASCLGYILPAMIYMKSYEVELSMARELCDKDSDKYNPRLKEQLAAFKRFYMPIFMLLFGVTAGILGVATVASGGG